MTAYDYDRQVWVEGREAALLAIKQAREVMAMPDDVIAKCAASEGTTPSALLRSQRDRINDAARYLLKTIPA